MEYDNQIKKKKFNNFCRISTVYMYGSIYNYVNIINKLL